MKKLKNLYVLILMMFFYSFNSALAFSESFDEEIDLIHIESEIQCNEIVSQRVVNHGNGFCDVYRTFRCEDGNVLSERWVGWTSCHH